LIVLNLEPVNRAGLLLLFARLPGNALLSVGFVFDEFAVFLFLGCDARRIVYRDY
jgi:hypothetical protein